MAKQAVQFDKQLETCPPDLTEAIQRKKAKIVDRRRRILDVKEVETMLRAVDLVFDKIASRLDKSLRGGFLKTNLLWR